MQPKLDRPWPRATPTPPTGRTASLAGDLARRLRSGLSTGLLVLAAGLLPMAGQAQPGGDPAPSAAPAAADLPASRPAATWGDDASAHRQGGDVFLAGGTPTVDDPVAGDLFVAGGVITVDAPVAGDLYAIGGRLLVGADVGRSLLALGGEIDVRAPVGRNLRVAGGRVELSPQGRVAGNVSAVGGQLRLRGPVQGHVMVAGGRVSIDGPVSGDVTATSGELVLGPNARIAGRLRYRAGDDLRRDPAAEVAGGVEQLTLPPHGDADDERHGMHDGAWPGRAVAGGLAVFWTVGLMVLAGAWLALTPGVLAATSRTVRTRAGASLLLGFALVVCVPVAALVLLLTIVGIPVALFGLALYLAALPLAYVAGAVAVADGVLARGPAARAAHRGWRFAAACAALLALWGLGWVPVVGWLAGLMVLLLGLGAIVLQLVRPLTAPPAVGA